MTARKKNTRPSADAIQQAEQEINDYSKTVKFTVVEYTFEFIVQRLNANRYYVPGYQRELTWDLHRRSKFIESAFMGLPLPFVFFWQGKDGRMEIVDGSQRLRTIRDFLEDKLTLQGLESIPALNGFRFSDLLSSRQLKFSETAIRVIILDNATDAVTRTEMFMRINTGGMTANDAEVRRGSLPGPFMDLIIQLANDETFVALTPISTKLIHQREREELVTRFFAYLNRFDPDGNDGQDDVIGYSEKPHRFFYQFVQDMNAQIKHELEASPQSAILNQMRDEFTNTLDFVRTTSPNGFTKSATGKQVPRVRFESIAVGTALALRADPTVRDRVRDVTPLLESQGFLNATKSDAANVRSKLLNRISLTRNWLLQQ